MAQIMTAATQQMVQEAATISSGVLATLTGIRHYDDLDRVRQTWIDRIARDVYGTPYTNWMEAWNDLMPEYRREVTRG